MCFDRVVWRASPTIMYTLRLETEQKSCYSSLPGRCYTLADVSELDNTDLD